jgi:hypothetical protein
MIQSQFRPTSAHRIKNVVTHSPYVLSILKLRVTELKKIVGKNFRNKKKFVIIDNLD